MPAQTPHTNGHHNNQNHNGATRNGIHGNGQRPPLTPQPKLARAAEMKLILEKVAALEEAYANEKRYEPTNAIQTGEELHQVKKTLSEFKQLRAERAKIVFAKRKRILEERAARPAIGLTSVNFKSQNARNEFFEGVISNKTFYPTLLLAAKKLSNSLRKRIDLPSITPLLTIKDVEVRPERMRTLTSERKYEEASTAAANVYTGYAKFCEGLLTELKDALPDDPTTKDYERQIKELRQRLARLPAQNTL